MSSEPQYPRADDIAISVRNLTKNYRLFNHPGDRIKQFLSLGLKCYQREFTALNDVSFDIKRGETVGIIGRNGSGKSTLLQLICGILKPTSGMVQVNGRISALLELGAGFNPEFTGRENVYFQGALMGFTSGQMDERFDDIASFADIGKFIDQPVRTYSSGMFVRLAFAVATNVSPDILVIDEALAVGDVQFQSKCFEHMSKFQKNGGAVFFVTHALEQIGHFCNRALLFDKGHLVANGAPSDLLTKYARLTEHVESPPLAHSHRTALTSNNYNSEETRWGDGKALIKSATLSQEGQIGLSDFKPGVVIDLIIEIEFLADIETPIFGLTIKSALGALVFNTNSRQLQTLPASQQRQGDCITVIFSFTPFLDSGTYLLSLGIAGEHEGAIVPHDRRYDLLIMNIALPRTATGEISLEPRLHILKHII